MSRAALLLLVTACSGSADEPKPEPVPAVLSDGGADAIAPPAVAAPTAGPTPKRPTRPIEIILRSTPGDAEAWVDGTYIGITPQVWGGDTGAAHTFMFKKAGHAMAQYRFVPVSSGILHPRLDPIEADVDAGVTAPREVAPVELAPPPSISADADSAPMAPPPDASPTGIGPQP